MSTLNSDNYSNHRPMTMIYQDFDIIPEGQADRTAAVLIGSRGKLTINTGKTSKANPALYDAAGKLKKQELILIRGMNDIYKYLCNIDIDGSSADKEIDDNNYLAKAAQFALTAGNGEAFYCICTDFYEELTEGSPTKNESLDRALNVMANTDKTMFVCPIIDGGEDLYKVISKCVECSKPGVQKWKRCYIGVPSEYKTADSVVVCKTASAVADWIKTIASKEGATLGDEAKRRTCFIWSAGAQCITATDSGNISPSPIDHKYIAAGVAALRASILPQQGLSRRTLPWIYQIQDAWSMSTQDMDDIATNGVFVITQDDPDSEVYVRHQLTNDLSRGILFYEDSVGVNVDDICYGLKDIIKGYIGQRNNTEDTLIEIKNKVIDYLLGLTSTGASIEARRIGPQLKDVDLDSLVVKIDDNFLDRVIISVDVVVPIPLNQIHVHLNAFGTLPSES